MTDIVERLRATRPRYSQTNGAWMCDVLWNRDGEEAAEELVRLRTELEAVKREAAEARVAELKEEVVFGFYEEEYPLFAQGYDKGINELSSPVTAEECKGYINEIVRLRSELEAVKREAVEVLKQFAAKPLENGQWSVHDAFAHHAARAFVEKHGRDG